MRALMLTAALALASHAYAQPSPDQSACAGDPRCTVVEPSDPRLQGGAGYYYPGPIDHIFLNGEAVKKGDCAQYLREHEQYHRKQHQEGRGSDEWAEEDARQNAPIYNCAKGSPRGTLNIYPGNPYIFPIK